MTVYRWTGPTRSTNGDVFWTLYADEGPRTYAIRVAWFGKTRNGVWKYGIIRPRSGGEVPDDLLSIKDTKRWVEAIVRFGVTN